MVESIWKVRSILSLNSRRWIFQKVSLHDHESIVNQQDKMAFVIRKKCTLTYKLPISGGLAHRAAALLTGVPWFEL